MDVSKLNLGDPDLELVDPTPNVHLLFVHFDKMFFWTKLSSRAAVRWSKRMYSCAGTCTYDRGGLCDIALSEPLLKLRPRKDLVETLLHEMIHAFLFVTNRDQDRDGHGPNFKAHMHRINKSAGLNISIYHDFHDEVKLYQTHWWRCNGPCQSRRPHFGIVRRSCNRAPGPSDFWWEGHKSTCNGTFVKIKEPQKQNKITAKPKPKEDISKYVTTNIKTIKDVTQNTTMKPVLKDSSNVPTNIRTKSNSSSTIVVSKKGVVFNPTAPSKVNAPPPVFTGKGHISGIGRSNTTDVAETVRNIWANKQIPTNAVSTVAASNLNKHKLVTDIQYPPAKVKKIDDYFKSTATAVLKELYGDEYEISQPNDSMKLIAIKVELVDCPICRAKFSEEDINKHLDECLNTEVIEELSKDINENIDRKTKIDVEDKKNFKHLIKDIPPIPAFKGKKEIIQNSISINNVTDSVDLTMIKVEKDLERGNEIDDEKKTLRKFKSIDDCTSIMNRKPAMSLRKSDSFMINSTGNKLNINSEPSTSAADVFEKVCPCCGKKFDKPVEEHLDECLIFFGNNSTIPEEGASTSSDIIVIDDDDDALDESMEFNATGTKSPCPCCMKMVEQAEMNDHLDLCLQS